MKACWCDSTTIYRYGNCVFQSKGYSHITSLEQRCRWVEHEFSVSTKKILARVERWLLSEVSVVVKKVGSTAFAMSRLHISVTALIQEIAPDMKSWYLQSTFVPAIQLWCFVMEGTAQKTFALGNLMASHLGCTEISEIPFSGSNNLA